jgi:hypothetical protein
VFTNQDCGSLSHSALDPHQHRSAATAGRSPGWAFEKAIPISHRSASTARSRFWKSKGKAPSCRGSATHCRSHAPVRASLRGGRQRRARDRGAGGLERDALDDGAVRGRRLILKSNHSFCLKPVRTQPISQPKKYTSPLAIAAPAMPIPSAQRY